MSRIPEIIDNRENYLRDTINTLIRNSEYAKIATGYFYLSGFNIVRENIPNNCKIQMIIGVETDSLTALSINEGYKERIKINEYVKKKMINSLAYLSDDDKENINTIEYLIKNGNMDVKIYNKDKFHSKAYIFDVSYGVHKIKDKYAIVGSSNFTKSGLGYGKSNTELNVVIRQPSAVNEVENWFDRIWDDSEPFNIDLLNIIESNFNHERLTNSPFEILLKSLFELYKDENIFNNLEDLNLDELTEFQEFAVYRAISILNKYRGVIIADSVGLGKTYIAKGILEYYSNLDKKVLIICPASLKEMWTKEVESIKMGIKILSQESIGLNGLKEEYFVGIEAILIDESHNFRNENSNRFQELIRYTMGKDIIQLTATPVNNSIFDLYNIMTLFIEDNQFKDKFGILSVRDSFKNYDKNKDNVDNMLSEIMIKRSRTFIRNEYGKDGKLIINGKELKFPKRYIKNVNYSLSEVYGKTMYDNISKRLENLYLPVISDENLSEKQIALIIGLVRKTFLKRLESSIEAFRNSIYRQLKYYELLIDGFEKGYLVIKKYIIENMEADLNMDIKSDITIPIDQYEGDVDQLRTNIISDYEDFKYIFNNIEKIEAINDSKLNTLITKLNTDLKYKKVIIFTEYKDTAKYIYKNINGKLDCNIDYIDGDNKSRKSSIINRFAPISNKYKLKKNEKEIDVLISTDVLSEGQNLQDCNILINYDLPWNPVKIIQREGRIDRITTEHDNIYIYNFMPESELEALLNLVDKINTKISYINETIGTENKILSEDEVIKEKVFNAEDIDSLKDLSKSDNKSILLDELEEKYDKIIPTEEYMRQGYKDLILDNKENINTVKNIKNGIYSIKKSDTYKGVYMYYKVDNKSYWIFYDSIKNEYIRNKPKIYNIISEGNNLDVYPMNRTIDFNIDEILAGGKQIVIDELNKIIQSQISIDKLDITQKKLAERFEKMLFKTKFRSRITREQREIRSKLIKPLHRGTIRKIKDLNIDNLTDEELLGKLDVILEYINVEETEEKVNYSSDNIELICYELII